jgi:two-component system sensor histidine kinase CpxA
MRSISAKIILWALGTFVLSLIAFGVISVVLFSRSAGPPDFLKSTVELLRDEAVRSYEEGGRAGLAAYLRRLDRYYYPAEHLLTDSRGRDLVTGADRSAMLGRAATFPGPPRRVGGRLAFERASGDGRYRFVTLVRPPFDPWGFLPYYGAILLVIALMSSALSVHLVRPLRHLRRAVDRFGQGDLSARAGSTRKDEIGALARAFDEMAGRIELLLAAERRLLQDVSHELRSPLARLRFAVALARSGDDRETASGRITREIDRLTALVDELLRLTRSEGDVSALDAEDVSLDELLHALADDSRLEAEAKACRLVVRADRAVVVRGERELIRRAVENVLRNAVRYAPAGTAVEIDLRQTGGVAAVTIRDHGPGVPEECRESIFEPFYRLQSDRSRNSGGTGLGLSIARRAVALHQGRIVAANAEPGLSVTIELPVVPREPNGSRTIDREALTLARTPIHQPREIT